MKRVLPRRLVGKTGFNVSSIGLGGTSIGHVYNEFDAPDLNESYEMIKYSLDQGCNIIDTSPLYGFGKSETDIGIILNKLDRQNIYKRESYYLCSKCGRYDFQTSDYSAKRTEKSIEESLNRLQTDYLDILYIHDFELSPHGLQQIWEETLPFLYELKNKSNNVIKAIGLSGQQLIVMDYVLRQFGYDKIDVILTYNNYNIPDIKLLNFIDRLNKYNIGIIQGGSTYHGLLTSKGPQSWFPHQKEFIKYGKLAVNEINNISKKYYGDKYNDDAISRLAFLFTHSLKDISTVLVATNTLNEMKRNINYILDGNYDTDKCELNHNDKIMVKYLQSEIFADIMNIGTIEKAAKENVFEAYSSTVY